MPVAISSQLVVDASGLLNLGLELDLASTTLPQTLHALKGGERLVVWPSNLDLHHRLHAILRHGEMRESGVSCIPRGVAIADGTRVLEGAVARTLMYPILTLLGSIILQRSFIFMKTHTPLLDILTSIAAARQLTMPCMVLASRSLVCSGPPPRTLFHCLQVHVWRAANQITNTDNAGGWSRESPAP